MEWVYTLPEKSGKYVVQTKSVPLEIVRTVDSVLTFDKKKKPSWSFNNQVFYRYLKE